MLESTSSLTSSTPSAGVLRYTWAACAITRLLAGWLTPQCCVFSFLHTRLRTATLRHDADGQAVLLNLLLRNYLHFNLYDQAEKLVSKSVFPELANNNEWARYLYYTGEHSCPGGAVEHAHAPRAPPFLSGCVLTCRSY